MASNIKRIVAITAGVAALAGIGLWGWTARTTTAPVTAAAEMVEVWKSPSCGCCGGWVDHMRAAGFTVKVHDVENMDIVKKVKGVPDALGSCHTALIGGYVVEGHVPAQDVRRLLAERPRAKGLSAPGMPQDAPGMDMNTGQRYDVVLFSENETKVFAQH